MYTSLQLLNMVKARYDLPSDYAAAKKIGVTRGSLSNIRCGVRSFSIDTSVVIADLLELDPLKIIASVQLERGQVAYNPRAIELFKEFAA